MTMKNMVYDALNYASQVTNISRTHRQKKNSETAEEYLSRMHKKDRLLPVVILVVYKAEGEHMILTLMQKLLEAGRIEDDQNASNDKDTVQSC